MIVWRLDRRWRWNHHHAAKDGVEDVVIVITVVGVVSATSDRAQDVLNLSESLIKLCIGLVLEVHQGRTNRDLALDHGRDGGTNHLFLAKTGQLQGLLLLLFLRSGCSMICTDVQVVGGDVTIHADDVVIIIIDIVGVFVVAADALCRRRAVAVDWSGCGVAMIARLSVVHRLGNEALVLELSCKKHVPLIVINDIIRVGVTNVGRHFWIGSSIFFFIVCISRVNVMI